MRTIAAVSTAAIIAAVSTWPHSAAAEDFSFTVVAGHPPITAGVAAIRDFFIPEVNRRLEEAGGNHTITWNEAYAGALADVQGVLEAVEGGVGDFGYVPHLFEADKLPLEQITYVTPFGTADLKTMMRIVRDLHEEVPEMAQAWRDNNQLMLAAVGVDNYHLMTSFPIETVEDIDGRKLSTAGLQTNWLRGTGAVPVAGALPDYYNSIQTGLTEGTVTFESALAPYKFFEVAPHVTKVNYGAQSSSALTVNLDVWEGLPDDLKQIIEEVAVEYQDYAADKYMSNAGKSLETAVAGGAQIKEVSDEVRAGFANAIPNIATEWAKSLDDRGIPGTETLEAYLRLSDEAGVKFSRDWLAE
ncbi:C4-dicarboxylate TRAP transporter substrate-binding protein [Mesorhizobium sp. CAU 1741]|uniref:C4-dicarboxylate TRAP transporter substrate-binding protein n=1 Tax=Mesorhizobium sp. CAU 1741 TaxID=3140366 RepID=UPI00325AFB3F